MCIIEYLKWGKPKTKKTVCLWMGELYNMYIWHIIIIFFHKIHRLIRLGIKTKPFNQTPYHAYIIGRNICI